MSRKAIRPRGSVWEFGEVEEVDDEDDGGRLFRSALMAYRTMPCSSRRLCRTLRKASGVGWRSCGM